MRIEASHNRNNRIIGKNPRLRQLMWGDIFMLYIELYMKAVPLKYSGGSRGGARGGSRTPPLFLDQTETRRVWMTALPPTPPPPLTYLKVCIRYWNIACNWVHAFHGLFHGVLVSKWKTNSPTENCLYWKSNQRSCMIDSWKPRLDLRRRSVERGLVSWTMAADNRA